MYEKEPPEMNEEKNRSKVVPSSFGASTKAQARAGQQLVENIKNILNEDLSSVVKI